MKVAPITSRAADFAPVAPACNVCRTCTTTNVVGPARRRCRGRNRGEALLPARLGRPALGQRFEPPRISPSSPPSSSSRGSGQALQAEDPFEQRRHPVAHRAADAARGPPRRSTHAPRAPTTERPRASAPLPAASTARGTRRPRASRAPPATGLARPAARTGARNFRIPRGPEGPAARDLLQHDAAATLVVALAQQAERHLTRARVCGRFRDPRTAAATRRRAALRACVQAHPAGWRRPGGARGPRHLTFFRPRVSSRATRIGANGRAWSIEISRTGAGRAARGTRRPARSRVNPRPRCRSRTANGA